MSRVTVRGIPCLAVVALAVFLENAAAQVPTRESDSPAGAGAVYSNFRVRRLKSPLEFRVEDAIRDAYGRCFKIYEIDGTYYRLRIPFGENGERKDEGDFIQDFLGEGKADPEIIWRRVDSLLYSEDFLAYRKALSAEGPKAIVFDLTARNWTVSMDAEDVEALRHGPYPGTRTTIHILKEDTFLSEIDLYNYLYCVGSVGLDCSGFVSFVQRAIANAVVPNVEHPEFLYSSLWYFTPQSGLSEIVDDRIVDLRPGDIFIFFGHEGVFRHSAVIQSIDWESGIIRYLQDTDWAPQEDRGVHESLIVFDPRRPQSRLSDPAVNWQQAIMPTFPGEPGLKYWRTDGDRYRTIWPRGRSLVVRLFALKELLSRLDAGFYRSRLKIEY